MNTVMLNTVYLDGGIVIKKGGGVTINNQSKSITITENGNSVVSYDSGYTGLEKVSVKVSIPNEEKTVEISENGTTEVVADSGFLSKVSVNVAIPTEEKPVDITENGTTEVVADSGFLSKVVVKTNVASSGGGSGWTGHADVEGLKAIGWTDEDIAYYQENGVNWNEEDDEYHKVTDDNKALYGVLTADNISTYKDRIVYLPKIDTSGKTTMSNMFSGCYSLVTIPQLDTQSVTNMNYMFQDCYSLVSIPQLDTQKVTEMSNMFSGCYSLTHTNLKNAKLACDLSGANLLSKESLLYLINNEAATSAITIKLASYAYTRLAEDADVVAALTAHPNISISQ